MWIIIFYAKNKNYFKFSAFDSGVLVLPTNFWLCSSKIAISCFRSPRQPIRLYNTRRKNGSLLMLCLTEHTYSNLRSHPNLLHIVLSMILLMNSIWITCKQSYVNTNNVSCHYEPFTEVILYVQRLASLDQSRSWSQCHHLSDLTYSFKVVNSKTDIAQ